MRPLMTNRFKTFWMPLILVVVSITMLWTATAADRATLVVFNANWCASCREVVPVVRDIASQNNLTVREIDVDSQTAPKEARSYGLSIPNDEPPQVYLVSRGRVTLLYNGRAYRMGYSESARAAILQNLQQSLGQ